MFIAVTEPSGSTGSSPGNICNTKEHILRKANREIGQEGKMVASPRNVKGKRIKGLYQEKAQT